MPKTPQPWQPSGPSTFDRVVGMGYRPGGGKLGTGGRPAGVFKRGPFKSFGR